MDSGTTALATSSDTAITLIANTTGVPVREITIVNEGAVAGFVSWDGGTTWRRMPAGPSSRTFNFHHPVAAVVMAKRVAGGTDMTGLWADAH